MNAFGQVGAWVGVGLNYVTCTSEDVIGRSSDWSLSLVVNGGKEVNCES